MAALLGRRAPAQPRVSPHLVAGVVVEVKDLALTCAFYEPIFRHPSGQWSEAPGHLTFRTDRQAIEFVRRARPRILADTAQHYGYRVSADRLSALADQLHAAGRPIDWWREDGPDEETIHAYLRDPSGHRVQLVPSDDSGLLIHHVAIEVVDLDYAEGFYIEGLGGQVEAYPGWSTDRSPEAQAWAASDDPCAPWTRYQRFSFRSRTVEGHVTPQLFIGFGATRLAIFLARKHYQEPPEETTRGTPRLVLRCRGAAKDLAEHLSGPARAVISAQFRGRTIRFEREGSSIYLQDPGGNYVQVVCDRE